MADPNIEVDMRSKSDCPFCDRARAWLTERGIRFSETKIEDPAARQALYDELGLVGTKRTVPQIFVSDIASGDRFHVGGWTELETSGIG